MNYISTRGNAPVVNFETALLAGLAPDGGLYVPQNFPKWHENDFAECIGKPFAFVAAKVLNSFAGGTIPAEIIADICQNTQNRFAHTETTPLIQIAADEYILELFHGPTLAFKDVAMQILGQLMNYTLTKQQRRATVIGATSGDTGSAAIEAFGGLPNVDVFILYPHNRVSSVQRRQMTTSPHKNIHALAVDGTFDDCQNIVKALFNDHSFRDEVGLTGVNSINWVRIASQIVYYITSALMLGAPQKQISFSVPTGNFGDIYAGFVAHLMGLPIEKLIIATNQNDILYRAFKTGEYTLNAVIPTTSPSMDIQISSNFERLLFEAYNHDAEKIRTAMEQLKTKGTFVIEPAALNAIKTYMCAHHATEHEVSTKIKSLYETKGYIVDPHTAVGLVASDKTGKLASPRITLATAHPAKFPDAVIAATGTHPKLPTHLSDLFERNEKVVQIENSTPAIAAYIRAQI